MILAARLLLIVAYVALAHAASNRGSGVLAAWALLDITVLVLLQRLLARQPSAWLLLAGCAAFAFWLAHTRFAMLPLLLMPVAFILMVGWVFARTLPPGRVPLITRLVAALDRTTPANLSLELRDYTRGVTTLWAGVLGAMALVNLLLALVAQPRGILAMFGLHTPFSVTQTQWSWFANLANYALVAAVFCAEYLYRAHRFPQRYHGPVDFARRLVALGPAFWRDFLR